MLRISLVSILTIALLSVPPSFAKGGGGGSGNQADRDGGGNGRGNGNGNGGRGGGGDSVGGELGGDGTGGSGAGTSVEGGTGQSSSGDSSPSGGAGNQGSPGGGTSSGSSGAGSGGGGKNGGSGGGKSGGSGGGGQNSGNSGGRSGGSGNNAGAAPGAASGSGSTSAAGNTQAAKGPNGVSNAPVAVVAVPPGTPFIGGEGNAEPRLPLSLDPRFVRVDAAMAGLKEPLVPRAGVPGYIVHVCRSTIVGAAIPYGAVHVDAASAGRLSRTRDGGFTAPIEVRVEYARANARQIRRAQISCRLNADGIVTALLE